MTASKGTVAIQEVTVKIKLSETYLVPSILYGLKNWGGILKEHLMRKKNTRISNKTSTAVTHVNFVCRNDNGDWIINIKIKCRI